MAIEHKLVSVEEFEHFTNQPENAKRRFELIGGVIYERNWAFPRESVIAARLGYLLNTFVIPTKIGYVAGSNAGFAIPPQDFFTPSVAFMAKVRLSELPDSYFAIPPDIAVEVVSPNDSDVEVHRKAMRYIALGTRLVWAVYPDEQVVHVYRPAEDGAHVQVVDINGTLDGGDVLPGFTLAVRDIFAAL
jgi:Uma2 family endonuclease